MNGPTTGPLQTHSRQSSQSSIRPLSTYQSSEGLSYVQQLRMTQATVWAGRGPRDAVNERKIKPTSSTKKSRFGMKLFSGQTPQAQKPLKSKLRLYAAAEHTTLVPRLSASEANDNDEFDNFTSSAPSYEKRHSNAPSIAKSSLHQSMSRNNSLHNTIEVAEALASDPSINKPARMSSVASSGATSSVYQGEDLFTNSSARAAPALPRFNNGSGSPSSITLPFTTSRSGSPTQLQQYSTQHVATSDSDEDEIQLEESRPRLFIANADISDSD